MLNFCLDEGFLGSRKCHFPLFTSLLVNYLLEWDVGGSELLGAKGQAGQRPRCLSVL